MGVEPIDKLLNKRWELVVRVADLRAKYGSFGTSDAIRKLELARLKGLIRAQALRDKRKVNNEIIDEEAHAHPDYADLIAHMTTERAKWVKIEEAIADIDFRLYRGQVIGRYAASEIRL